MVGGDRRDRVVAIAGRVHDGDPAIVALLDAGSRLALQHDRDGRVQCALAHRCPDPLGELSGRARPVSPPARRAGADHVGGVDHEHAASLAQRSLRDLAAPTGGAFVVLVTQYPDAMSGSSVLMYILRADALAAQRGDSPDLSVIYAPGTLRQARRRLVGVWLLSTVWIPGFLLGGLVALTTLTAAFAGLILALLTQFEAEWIGSPIRPWTRYAIPVALAGFVLVLTLG